MELSLDQIHLFTQCPAKYKMKYVDGYDRSGTKSVTFKKAIHRTISYFFYTAMGGAIPTLAQMKDKWANTWKEMSSDVPIDPATLILRNSLPLTVRNKQSKEEVDKFELAGLEMIYAFYSFNKNNPGNVIAVDQPYRVQIGDHVVTGKFELIREIVESDRKRYVEIIDFKTTDDAIDPFIIKNDYNLTIASYAFRNLFQNAQEDRMKYHYLKTGRDIITERSAKDYNRAKALVDGVGRSIANQDFYPRQSFMCKSCEYRDLCDKIIY